MSDADNKEPTQLTDDTLAGMSDEEFANLDVGFYSDNADDGNGPDEEPVDDTAEADDQVTDDDENSSDEPDTDDGDDSESAASDDADNQDADESEAADEDLGEGDVEKDTSSEEIDYKAEYEKLLAPFKANGKDMTVADTDEVRQLMQMGANYNKKMAALKPSLKTLKTLEKHKLLDPEKIGYLIDLSKQNPDAIKKLVKDSGIDPLDFDNEEESEYKPNTYNVDDRELDLDAVLDKIQDTPTYSKTISLVSNKWDGPSKRVVAENPQLLEVINDHMASGIYDRISNEVEKQQMLGRLDGLSNLEAYRTVGDELDAKGAFADLTGNSQSQQEPQRKTVVKKPKAQDAERNSKKRAASSTRSTSKASSGKSGDFNPLSLSDDEFEKLVNEKLM